MSSPDMSAFQPPLSSTHLQDHLEEASKATESGVSLTSASAIAALQPPASSPAPMHPSLLMPVLKPSSLHSHHPIKAVLLMQVPSHPLFLLLHHCPSPSAASLPTSPAAASLATSLSTSLAVAASPAVPDHSASFAIDDSFNVPVHPLESSLDQSLPSNTTSNPEQPTTYKTVDRGTSKRKLKLFDNDVYSYCKKGLLVMYGGTVLYATKR